MKKIVVNKINKQVYIIISIIFLLYFIISVSYKTFFLFLPALFIPFNIIFMYLFNKLQCRFTLPALYDRKIYKNILAKFIFFSAVISVLCFIPYFRFMNIFSIFLLYIPLFIYIFSKLKFYRLFYPQNKKINISISFQRNIFFYELLFMMIITGITSYFMLLVFYITGIFTGIIPFVK